MRHISKIQKQDTKFYYEGLGTAFEFKEYPAVDSASVRAIQGKIDITDSKWRKTGYKESGSGAKSLAGNAVALAIQQRLQKATFELVDYLEAMYITKEINVSASGSVLLFQHTSL